MVSRALPDSHCVVPGGWAAHSEELPSSPLQASSDQVPKPAVGVRARVRVWKPATPSGSVAVHEVEKPASATANAAPMRVTVGGAGAGAPVEASKSVTV